jgi:hypothetical protein
MKNTLYPFLFSVLFFTTGCVKLNCPLPENLNTSVKKETLSSTSASADLGRDSGSMGGLCANRVTFYEDGKKWTLLLVRNTKQPRGPFWYLPHDNENTAFQSAVYATKKYGGGFLAVEANGQRMLLVKIQIAILSPLQATQKPSSVSSIPLKPKACLT